jgi:CheY-like chemotaxis protein
MKQKLNCILLIDDDEPTNFLTQIFLEEYGCCNHVKAVQSGKEALEYLTKSAEGSDPEQYPSPDLIFLDVNMPAMNGWEFLDNYTRMDIGHEHKTIVVMLTTSLFPEDKAKATQRKEVAGFEHKPLTIENLEKLLKKHFTTYVD